MKVMMFSKESFEADIPAGIKSTTMRPRHGDTPRFNAGETVSARRWTGKAYRSSQREFAHVRILAATPVIYCCGQFTFRDAESSVREFDIQELAKTEGFSSWQDLREWFDDASDKARRKREIAGFDLPLWLYRFELVRAIAETADAI